MRRNAARCAILICAPLVLVACGLDGAALNEGPEIVELSQGTFTVSDFPLQVEWSLEPRILDLRAKERLDAVAAGAQGELDLFKRLTVWSRAQFEPGVPDPYPPCDGISLLREIRSGKTGGFCGQYSYLLGDALKSFGYFAVRYVELESESGQDHFAVEVWCNDLGRWVLLDPLHAALYTKEGAPLSALELHESLLDGSPDAIRINRLPLPARKSPGGEALPAGPADDDSPESMIAVFYNVAVSTRNDFARLPHPLTIDERERIFLRFDDPRVAPFRHLSFPASTKRREDILTPMNQVAIDLKAEPGKALYHVSFSTKGTCPHFMRYRIRIGEGSWKDAGPMIAWALAPGESTLEVRTVNAFEVLGPVFRARVRL